MSGYFKDNDPMSFRSQISELFPNTGISLTGLPHNIYAMLSRSEYNKLSSDKKIAIESKVLTKNQANTYADLFRRAAARSTIPWILGPAGLLPGVGAAISITTSTLDGLYRLAGASSISAACMAVLMAEGGRFTKYYSLAIDPSQGELLVIMVFYLVSLGKENRMYGVYSAKYALKVEGS
ncbi:hypothetical protein [Thalassomonas haliotis]|uniref:Uncharacterized protein n=1 Tax=Thalassomonas haliotis TaxID=485448 RepID=A0ABY7V9W8_9GAMM|nr:hypothetical protein [Thalassomonas haliotis]WDE10162.1 hypothetical protein H3N35_17995 [Thalassomonas haliotis]